MSEVRNTFCTVAARGKAGFSRPNMYGLNWFMPALVRSSVGSFGISEEDGTTLCPRSSKKPRKTLRMVFASTETSVYRPWCRHPRASAQEVLGDAHPELGGQAERLLVDPFVVAVEHRHELGEGDPVAEQPRPVGDRPRPTEEPGVGRSDDHERNGPGSRHQGARHPLD